MSATASQITDVSIVCTLVCSGADQTSRLRVTGLCEGNSSVTGEFPAQRPSNAESVSIRWRDHEVITLIRSVIAYCVLLCQWDKGIPWLWFCLSNTCILHKIHQMPLVWTHVINPLWGEIHRSPVDSHNTGQLRGALMCSLICSWTNGGASIKTPVIWDAIALIMTSL